MPVFLNTNPLSIIKLNLVISLVVIGKKLLLSVKTLGCNRTFNIQKVYLVS